MMSKRERRCRAEKPRMPLLLVEEAWRDLRTSSVVAVGVGV